MSYNDYDLDKESYYWEDNDNQDGTYYKDYEKPSNEDYSIPDDREWEHEERMHKAALYIRLHYEELMKDEEYRIAYYKLVDYFARQYAYIGLGKPISKVTQRERDLENRAFDCFIEIEGEREIEKYKSDAIYIVNWLKTNKSLLFEFAS